MAAKGVQAAALLCLVLLAASPQPAPAEGTCQDGCVSACTGWPVLCKISCASACLGEVGISTLSTTAKAEPPNDAAEAEAPAPQHASAPAPQQGALRGLKPSPAH